MNRTSFWTILFAGALGCFFAPSFLGAAETVFSASGRQDPIDNLGGGVRSVAMGSAFVGVADDSTAVFWNPAGLSQLRLSELTVQHASWFGTHKETVFFGIRLPKAGGLGISGGFMDYGSFDGSDEDGFSTGTYSANQLDLTVGWGARVVGVLSVGVQVHGVQQTLAEDSSSIFTGGMGLLAETSGGWRIGAAFMNGGLTKESAGAESSFRAGLAKRWDFSKGWGLLAVASGNLSPRAGNSFQCGFEADHQGRYFLRAGYDHRTQDPGFEGMVGPTVGLGLSWGPLRLDYAFVPYGDLGQSQQLGMVYRFGTSGKPLNPQVTVVATATPRVITVPVTVYLPLPMSEAPSVGSPASGQVNPQPIEGSAPAKTGELVMDFEEVPSGTALARPWVQQGRETEAIQAYVDALKKDPQDVRSWWELGGLYYRLGHKAYAVKCYETVLTLQPGNQDLARWLANYQAGTLSPTPGNTP